MKNFYIFTLLLIITSCIPIKIAPNLEEGKILKARRFVKQLGNRYVYAFEDPKNANEFYRYINAKYQVSYDDLDGNIKFLIDKKSYYLTFYEVNKETKTINLIPIIIDSALEAYGQSRILEDEYSYRTGTWYVAITVTDREMKDCLRPKHEKIQEVEEYLTNIQRQYLTTTHYLTNYLEN